MNRHGIPILALTALLTGHAYAQVDHGVWDATIYELNDQNYKAIHAILLPPTAIDEVMYAQGLVLYIDSTGSSGAPLWDPISRETVAVTPPPDVNLFCSGHAFDA